VDLRLDNMLYDAVHAVRSVHAGAERPFGATSFSSMRRGCRPGSIVLYIVFFIPGIAALIYAGYTSRRS
jgi:hypothetical protein